MSIVETCSASLCSIEVARCANLSAITKDVDDVDDVDDDEDDEEEEAGKRVDVNVNVGVIKKKILELKSHIVFKSL